MARRVAPYLVHGLPKRMFPPLQQSLHNHLESAKPLVTHQEFVAARRATLEFGKSGGVGEYLHGILERSIQNDDMWINENLLQDVFLKDRRPYLYLSAAAICPRQSFKDEEDQLKFAAALTAGVLDFKRQIDTETLSQDVLKGKLLCMKQYESLFGTCRIPGIRKDTIFQTQSRHIVVASNNHFYRVNVLDDNGVPLPVEALYNHLQYINQATRVPDVPIGLLTTDNRTTWARVYDMMKTNPENQKTLDTISSAIFLLCIDGASIINAASHPGQNALLGGGSAYNSGNRWFYKVTQLFVGREGQVGAVYDHALCDGSVRGRMFDYAFAHAKSKCSFATRSEYMTDSEKPTKLSFEINSELQKAIECAGKELDKYCQDVQISFIEFENYGKRFLKSNGLYPDSFIQMAMQLTNFRLFNQPMPSRETISLMHFRYGRTDFVRVPSDASNTFVRSMDGSYHRQKGMDTISRRCLFNAIAAHQRSIKWVMAGNGVDTHLRGLKLIADNNGDTTPEFFQDPTYLKMQQSKYISTQMAYKHVRLSFVLPKVEGSYSIQYNVQDNCLLFIVSAFRHSTCVPVEVYATELKRSLLDMQSLLLEKLPTQHT